MIFNFFLLMKIKIYSRSRNRNQAKERRLRDTDYVTDQNSKKN